MDEREGCFWSGWYHEEPLRFPRLAQSRLILGSGNSQYIFVNEQMSAGTSALNDSVRTEGTVRTDEARQSTAPKAQGHGAGGVA